MVRFCDPCIPPSFFIDQKTGLYGVYAGGQVSACLLPTESRSENSSLRWLWSGKLLSVLNFCFAFVPAPWRDNSSHFCSLKMPLEIMSECSKQLRLTLPYFSDKTGEGAHFFPQNNTDPLVETLWIRFLFFLGVVVSRDATKLVLNRNNKKKVRRNKTGTPHSTKSEVLILLQ